MKTVLLMRHGKSDWKAPFNHDHERPINARGRRSARAMGIFLTRTGQVPDLIVTSSAVRARTTVEMAAEAGGWECEMKVTDRLYGASFHQVMAQLHQTADSVSRILLAGHEPTWSDCAGRLIGTASIRFPTAAITRIDFPRAARWTAIEPGSGMLRWHLPPRLVLHMTG